MPVHIVADGDVMASTYSNANGADGTIQKGRLPQIDCFKCIVHTANEIAGITIIHIKSGRSCRA